ncbi:MAG: ribonuclease Z [Bdellovibrionales bacterium]|nr:ribonuclease Z [Bdellovibrionales bacterium]
MKLHFLGVGEAFDPRNGNSSYLLETDRSTVLLDCGHTVPRDLFARLREPDQLSGILLSHFHGDHFFGLPFVLYRLHFDGRTAPLVVAGPSMLRERVQELCRLAYGDMLEKLAYPLELIEGDTPLSLNELDIQFARTDHPVPNNAMRIAVGDQAIFISGDGALTEQSRSLLPGCALVVHEAYLLNESTKGHTTAAEVVAAVESVGSVGELALVHINRDERRSVVAARAELEGRAGCPLRIPEPGELWEST